VPSFSSDVEVVSRAGHTTSVCTPPFLNWEARCNPAVNRVGAPGDINIGLSLSPVLFHRDGAATRSRQGTRWGLVVKCI